MKLRALTVIVTVVRVAVIVCIVYVNVCIASDFKLIWQSLINK